MAVSPQYKDYTIIAIVSLWSSTVFLLFYVAIRLSGQFGRILVDLSFALAWLVHLGECIPISYVFLTTSNDHNLSSGSKALRAGQIFYLLCLGTNKICCAQIIALMFRPKTKIKRLCQIYSVVAIFYTVVSILVVRIDCAMDKILQPTGVLFCSSEALRWTIILVVDVLMDVSWLLLEIRCVWTLEMVWTRRVVVVCIFAFRTIHYAAILTLIIYYRDSIRHPDDAQFLVRAISAQQISSALNIITAIAPAITATLKKFGTTGLTFGEIGASGCRSGQRSGGTKLYSSSQDHELDLLPKQIRRNVISISGGQVSGREGRSSAESQGSNADMIRKHTDVLVEIS